MTLSDALPVRPEPEVLFQSWDPPSGPFMLSIQMEVAPEEWRTMTWGEYDDLSEPRPGARSRENANRLIMTADTEEALLVMSRRALNVAMYSNIRTRVVRFQALL